MFKRNKSYLLLTFLVLTGFGGRIHSDSLPGRERKVLIRELKESKKELFKSLAVLNQSQLDFRTTPNDWTIRENIYHLALSENKLWNWTEAAMKEKSISNTASRLDLQDTHSSGIHYQKASILETNRELMPSSANYKNLDEAIEDFKTKRSGIIKFVRTTTDDIRTCKLNCILGETNTYQLLVFLSDHTDMHLREIEKIKNNPDFPK